jgi:hypothetical protein
LIINNSHSLGFGSKIYTRVNLISILKARQLVMQQEDSPECITLAAWNPEQQFYDSFRFMPLPELMRDGMRRCLLEKSQEMGHSPF